MFFCTCSVHISSSQALYNKNPIISSLYGKSPEQPKFGLDFVEAIPNFFCTFQDFHLLYIVREKMFAMLTMQVLLLCLIPTSLAQVGVFFIFSKVGLVVEIIITFYQFEQNQWHLLLKVEKRPTNHGWELRSLITRIFVKIPSTPSHDIKLKIEKTQGQGEE